MSLPSKTILGNLAKEQATSASHPLFYTRQRTHYLSRLSQQVTAESQLPTVDLRRNMRVDHYLSQYNGLKAQQQKYQRVQNTLLKTNQFNSLFQQEEMKKRQQRRLRKENQSIQDELYKKYVQQANFYQPAEREYHTEDEKPQTILALGDSNKMKELYLIDLEIGRLRQEERISKVVKDRHQECQNNELLGKLSSSIISSYMVYFDEIYELLIDDLLQEEVIFLNQMQAQYKVGRHMHVPSNKSESKQTLQMMELVRSLEQLCDD